MDRITFGRTSLLCTLLFWAFQVSSGAGTVQVKPVVEVLIGETAKLPCRYPDSQTSSSSSVVEWFIDEQGTRKRVAFHSQSGQGKSDESSPLTGRIKIEDDFTLTISPVKPSDELTFHCQVTDGPSGGGEGTIMLKVFVAPEKPQLIKPPSQAISVLDTTSSQIGTCETKNGHPRPRIVWFKDNKPMPEVKDRAQKTYMVPSVVKEASDLLTVSSTLYMQPTKADKDSVFHCTVEYSMPGNQIKMMRSNHITINLSYPSEKVNFTLGTSKPIKEGDTVTMNCETDGNPQPQFDFNKEEKRIEGQQGILTLKSVKRTDTGRYFCTALDFENLDAELKGDINLTVHYIDPLNVTPAEPQVVEFGNEVKWQCKTKASQPHTVQWKKGSEVLSQDGTLSIKAVTYDNAGQYMCVGAVPSVPGLTAQDSVNLTVKGKPVIDHPAPVEVGKEGDMVTLKCSAFGFPFPQFTWKPSGEQQQSVQIEGNKMVSTVTLKTTTEIMKNGVICEASNDYGTDRKPFLVALKRAIGSSPEDMRQGGSSGVVIAVVVCVLLLLLLVALLYFLSKKSKLSCSKKSKKDMPTEEVNNEIVVEMKSDKANEEAGLLNKKPPTEQ